MSEGKLEINTFPAPRFPKAILSTSREEFYGQDNNHHPLKLTVKDGKTGEETQIPDDLKGHLFIIAPSGSVDSPSDPNCPTTVFPSQDGWTPILEGDGMVYRLDFHQTPDVKSAEETISSPGQAWWASRMVETPTYHVDRLLYNFPDRYPSLGKLWQFQTLGIARLSMAFGACDQNNTSLIPLKFSQQTDRLLVTEDIGRPWEIDPRTLKLLAPVGMNQDWLGVIDAQFWSEVPFSPVMTSAHSVFDSNTEEFFTVNVVKSLSYLLGIALWISEKIHELKIPEWIVSFLRWIVLPFQKTLNKINKFLFKKIAIFQNSLYLLRWKGNDDTLEKWKVVLPDGSPVCIKQTIHQMGITEKYVILADTSLKLALDDFIPRIQHGEIIDNLLREVAKFTQASQTDVYIISRDDLQQDPPDYVTNKIGSVTARKVTLPEALVHYVVDYENPGSDREYLILHTTHVNAWDTAEFVHGKDRTLATENPEDIISGMVTTSTDVNHLSSYVINTKTGSIQRQDVDYGDDISQYPWSIAFYAYRESANHQQPDRFENLYWNSWGLWGDLFTDFITKIYKHYQPRILDIEKVKELAKKQGIPAQLCRVKIDRKEASGTAPKLALKMVDRYQFPPGYFGTSAQFIPRAGTTSSEEGYLVCMVLYDDDKNEAKTGQSEIWIFDAQDFSRNSDGEQCYPLYRLSHPQLNFGFTAHTTWLADIQSPSVRQYDVVKDHQNWLNNIDRNILERLLKLSEPIATFQDLKQDLNQLFQDMFEQFQPEPPKPDDDRNFPRTVTSVRREEFYHNPPALQPLELTIRDGQDCPATLPPDLQGHSFIISAAGSVSSAKVKEEDSTVLPSKDGWTPLLNGDGIIYRIDFHNTPGYTESGKAWLTTRLVKPPVFYADALTHFHDSQYTFLKFWNIGLSRFSPWLGLCEQGNTALTPVRFSGEKQDRLIATNDATRPYEIDPLSLKTLAPVGLNKDWERLLQIPLVKPFPFQGMMTSAHPGFDPKTQEFFTVNILKSLTSILRDPDFFTVTGKKDGWSILWEILVKPLIRGIESLVKVLDRWGFLGTSSLYLVRWQGDSSIEKWKVILPNRSPVRLNQSSHMLGLSERYIILVDTAFKLAPEDMLPSGIIRKIQRWVSKVDRALGGKDWKRFNALVQRKLDRLLEQLREHLTYPQAHDTYAYIIDRACLKTLKSGESITAIPATIPGEFCHFLTDYQETNGKIIIHPGMTYATDPAEFIHKLDRSVYSDDPKLDRQMQKIAGMWTAGMDVNSPAVIAIDPQNIDPKTGTATVQKYDLNLDESIQNTFFLGLYTYRDDRPTEKFEDIYWIGGGAWKEMLTQLIYDLYEKNYPYRRLDLDRLKQMIADEIPVRICRLHIDRQKLENPQPNDAGILSIQDSYTFEQNYLPNSPQFIPRPGSQGATEGYLMCNVIHTNHLLSDRPYEPGWSNNSELWIFKAENLAAGPQYKLSHPQLNFGLTIHTLWMKDIQASPPRFYNIREDYDWLVENAANQYAKNPLFWLLTHGKGKDIAKQMRDLFEEIYRRFEENR